MFEAIHPGIIAALSAAVSAAGGFVGAWSAMNVHMKYLRRDVDHAHRRIDELHVELAQVRR